MTTAATAGQVAETTRTQRRRDQRQQALRCYRRGALQRMQHFDEFYNKLNISVDTEARELLASIAVHRADVDAAGFPIHFAATANAQSLSDGLKSVHTFKGHRKLHQQANRVKHDYQPAATVPEPTSTSGPDKLSFHPSCDPAIHSWAAEGVASQFHHLQQPHPFVPFAGQPFQMRASAEP